MSDIEIKTTFSIAEVGLLLLDVMGEGVPAVRFDLPDSAGGEEGITLPVDGKMAKKLGGFLFEKFDVRIVLTPNEPT